MWNKIIITRSSILNLSFSNNYFKSDNHIDRVDKIKNLNLHKEIGYINHYQDLNHTVLIWFGGTI
jgi:hypothetical protein